jgi:hypothetical protein
MLLTIMLLIVSIGLFFVSNNKTILNWIAEPLFIIALMLVVWGITLGLGSSSNNKEYEYHKALSMFIKDVPEPYNEIFIEDIKEFNKKIKIDKDVQNSIWISSLKTGFYKYDTLNY